MHLFTFQNGVFSPDGKTDTNPTDVDRLNAEQNTRDIEHALSGPPKLLAYIDASGVVSTWLGTTLGRASFGPRQQMSGYARHNHMDYWRAVHVKIGATWFYGREYHTMTSGNLIRLTRSKRDLSRVRL